MSNTSDDRKPFRVNVRLHRFGETFHGSFPDFSRPEPIGFYSVNESCEFQNNANNSTYLRLPQPSEMPLDLNAGIEDVQRKIGDPDFMDIAHICQYIFNHQKILRRSSTGGMELPADIVTLRGVLRKIMCTPYESNRAYSLRATLLNGTVYIAKQETESERIDREQMSPKHMSMCSWGFKFEQYCTTSKPGIAPITNMPVNECKEFACVYRSKLNGLRLLYGAEMDCINSDVYLDLNDPDQLRSAEFVELKTSACKMTKKQRQSFDKYKSLNWWSQSFLVGIQTIVVGLRDENGLVHDIKKYPICELHRKKLWNPAAAVAFLSNFLHELKAIMLHVNDPSAQLLIDFTADRKKVLYSVLRGSNVKPILPEWYTIMMRGDEKS